MTGRLHEDGMRTIWGGMRRREDAMDLSEAGGMGLMRTILAGGRRIDENYRRLTAEG